MTERMTKETDAGYVSLVLTTAILAEKGKMACLDTTTGKVTKGAASATLIPVGYFNETMTGDGTAQVIVRLFREVKLHWWTNDGVAPVVSADIGSDCYIKDDTTVSSDGTGRSVAGKVWALSTTDGVLVSMAMPAV
jgi:hypothetical protein